MMTTCTLYWTKCIRPSQSQMGIKYRSVLFTTNVPNNNLQSVWYHNHATRLLTSPTYMHFKSMKQILIPCMKRWSQTSSHSQSLDFKTLTKWTQRLISRIKAHPIPTIKTTKQYTEQKLLIRHVEQVLFHWATIPRNTIPPHQSKSDFVEEIMQTITTFPDDHHQHHDDAGMILKPTVTTLRYAIEVSLESYDETLLRKDLDRVEQYYFTLLQEEVAKTNTRDTQLILETCFARIIHAFCKSHKNGIKVEIEEHGQPRKSIHRAWNLIHRTQEWQEKRSKKNSQATFYIPGSMEEDGVDGKVSQENYSVEIINAMLHLFSTMGDERSLHRAKQILDEFTQDGGKKCPLVTLSYNLVLQGYCQAGRLDDAQKILFFWIDAYRNKTTGSRIPSPDVTSWNILLNAYADVGDSTRIENLLQFIETMEDIHIQPDRVSYSALIRAYSLSGDAIKAEAVLERMIRASADHEEASPDHIAYSAVVDAWDKSVSKKQQGQRHVSSLLDWEHAVDRCWKIIHFMESKATEMDRKDQRIHLMPSTATFNSLLHLVSQSPSGHKASSEAIRIFDYMNRQPFTKPNMATFSILFPILGRCKMHDQAQNLFQQLLDGKWGEMNIVTFNAFLTSLVGVQSQSAVDYALNLLHKMKHEGNGTLSSLVPTTRTYNIILNIIAKSGRNPDQAEQLLTEMETLDRHPGSTTVVPNTISYTSCINAIARSDALDKIQRTKRILERIQQSYHQGNKEAYVNTILLNSVLNSCCFVKSKSEFKDALLLAQELMLWTRESGTQSTLMTIRVKVDSITYATIIKVFARTMDDIQVCETAIAKEFRNCCKDGLVNDVVLQALKTCTSDTLYHTLVEEYHDKSSVKKMARKLHKQ